MSRTTPLDFDGRVFRSIDNSAGGEVDAATIFRYRQQGPVVWATYSGGRIAFGTMVGIHCEDGSLDMRYQHVSGGGDIRTGRCVSRPEVLPDGRVRLHEAWEWTEGGVGRGTSVVEEQPVS